ncbi:hypothetical protein D9619_002779 [Psilocybe cf. subviscida]|uniref:Uncharacterized protein n=1 Tax=Psilocybe cf. subviscida TaxID=2480587 RepID=A0A8H5ETX3_9AGAR|nr:hypothetical protein D9619_002779 [Psilocybe cf. subviscida]
MASSTSPKPEEAHDSASHHLPTQKLTALTRLKSFGGSFINSRKASPPIVFPPPSWELSDDLLGNTASSSASLNESNFQDAPVPEQPEQPEQPEPLSFAQRLRSLIESLPISGSPLPSNTPAKTTPAVEGEGSDGKSGAPVPPDMDPKLVRMLSSEEVMNGKQSKSPNEESNDRPGVWNILASLRKGDTTKTPRRGAVEEEEGGIMMYSPLEPKADSKLELASSEPVVGDAPQPSTKSEKGKNEDVVTEKRAWVPSTTELSVLATWWGYRLYLPPPIMAKLDGTSVKATARAAMVTAALKWMLDKMPLMLVPVQFRPAVIMLKKLSPVVGYIGVFIAWSWDRVRACDQGNGVVLTATWLLPVALLPMTWDAGDIYGPRPPPKPEDMPVPQATGKGDKPSEQATASADALPPSKEKKGRSLFPW